VADRNRNDDAVAKIKAAKTARDIAATSRQRSGAAQAMPLLYQEYEAWSATRCNRSRRPSPSRQK
jgi:hypothetical protein